MNKTIFFTVLFLVCILGAGAQHQEVSERPAIWKDDSTGRKDTSSLLGALRNGKIHAHFRYFFMATDNAAGLSGYYAHAMGGGLRYETGSFRGFQVGISGFFIYNVGSSDLTRPDPATGQLNRYEIGLFDITNPSNKRDINRLEELFVKYSWKASTARYGKQLLNTPFINLQDGRMRPTEVSGLWIDFNQVKGLRLEGGFLNRISPRSTVRWYSIGESIGLYPSGVNPEGLPSGYKGNLESPGIGMLGATWNAGKNLKVQLWDLTALSLFHTVMIQGDYQWAYTEREKVLAGIQYVRQDALGNGGNADPSMTYFPQGGHSNSISARLGWENKQWEAGVAYTRITKDGRFLVPREWGRDPFYTFMPRERNEGFGDVHAIVVKAATRIPATSFRLELGLGHFSLPDVTNTQLNKYGVPSYNQLNAGMRYAFPGFLEGLDAQLLYVYKQKAGESYNNNKYIINKVDMGLWNLVFNYRF